MSEKIDLWLKKLGSKPIPVLANTIKDLAGACQSDDVAVSKIVAIIERDPGLTVQLLRTCSQKAHGSLQADVNSVQQALMMLGTQTVSNLARSLPTVEKDLPEKARTQVLFTFTRAYFAGMQAYEWARQRRDMTPDEVFASAQLHFLGEMILSIFAPEKLREIYLMRTEEHVASEEAQYIILGFTLDQLSLKIAERWHLPNLVSEALHPENARFPRAYGVMLAVQLARYATTSWTDPNTTQLMYDAAEWLGEENIDKIIAGCHSVAAEAARGSARYAIKPAALQLVQLPAVQEPTNSAPVQSDAVEAAGICLSPQLDVLKTQLQHLSDARLVDKKEIVATTMAALHDGIGLNRVVFVRLDSEAHCLRAYAVAGTENDPNFNRFHLSLKQPHLFHHLMEKMQGIWINDQNREKLWPMVPKEFQRMIMVNSFLAMSIFVDDKPLGLVYADRHTRDCVLDAHSYQYFKTVCLQFAKSLARVKHLNFTH
ncbi:MAG: HDOD domain-containing protein [Gammaproteobacteria bacterium]